MTEKRFTIKPQDDYFGVTDNYSTDKVNVVNGIHTEIEAEWLCELLNELHEENQVLLKLQKENSEIKQLIHTMLMQMDIEKINTENARYSARIIFTLEEFKKMRQIWKGD